MRGHNVGFHREIRKIILELSSVPPLIWSCGIFSSPGQSSGRAIVRPPALALAWVLALAAAEALAK